MESNPTTPPGGRADGRWRVLPPFYLLAAFVLMHVLDKHLPLALWFHKPWKMLGWLPIVLGMLLSLAGAGMFRWHRTTIRPFKVSRALVTAGAYRLTRNPMYLGMVLVLIGTSLTAGSASVWVVPLLFVWAIDRRFIRMEEAMLAERFGEDYAAYRRRVRRWI